MGPPADREYAVDPVGVEMMIPSGVLPALMRSVPLHERPECVRQLIEAELRGECGGYCGNDGSRSELTPTRPHSKFSRTSR